MARLFPLSNPHRGKDTKSRRRGDGRRGRQQRREIYAAIDLGTNNCRLLVAKPTRGGFQVIDAFSRIVRLGEGLSRSGALSPAAMDRTVDGLRICASKMRRRGVTRARAVATEACRRADNCEVFLARVREETGIELEIISTDEEAQLALHGCAQLLDPGLPHALIFDIGGGSTELSWLEIATGEGNDQGENGRPSDPGPSGSGQPDSGPDGGAPSWMLAERTRLLGWHSVPRGVVSLAEHYGGEAVSATTYAEMVGEMCAAIRPFEEAHGLRDILARGEVQMLGTSGTVTTLAGVHKDLPRYDRASVDGCYLGFDTVRRVSERIAGMSYDERAGHPCIGRERADLVVAGCAILEAVCQTWPVGRLRVADRGLREGILFNLMREDRLMRQNREAQRRGGKPDAAREDGQTQAAEACRPCGPCGVAVQRRR